MVGSECVGPFFICTESQKSNSVYKYFFLLWEAVKVEKKCDNYHTFLTWRGGSEVIITLFILCLKWPIIRPEMQRKFWVEGGGKPPKT